MRDGDQPSVFVNAIESLETAREKRTRAINIAITTMGLEGNELEPVYRICENHPGNLNLWIKLVTSTSGTYQIKSKKFRVANDKTVIKELRQVLGAEQVWIS